jgi:hypothetical protein
MHQLPLCFVLVGGNRENAVEEGGDDSHNHNMLPRQGEEWRGEPHP